MEDECHELRMSVFYRKKKQNERRAKANKPPMWPGLKPPPSAPAKAAARPGKPALPMPESGDIDDSAMSFAEWSQCGWAVKKGEKTCGFDLTGIAQFTLLQVRRYNPAWAAFRKRHP